jgi:hypothetical protein
VTEGCSAVGIVAASPEPEPEPAAVQCALAAAACASNTITQSPAPQAPGNLLVILVVIDVVARAGRIP